MKSVVRIISFDYVIGFSHILFYRSQLGKAHIDAQLLCLPAHLPPLATYPSIEMQHRNYGVSCLKPQLFTLSSWTQPDSSSLSAVETTFRYCFTHPARKIQPSSYRDHLSVFQYVHTHLLSLVAAAINRKLSTLSRHLEHYHHFMSLLSFSPIRNLCLCPGLG